LRRLTLVSFAVLALALPAAASAQLPIDPGKPPGGTPTPKPTPAQPKLTVHLKSGLRERHRIYVLAHQRVRVRGHVNRAAAGEHVLVELFHKGRRVGHRSARVGGRGRFHTKVRARGWGHYSVRARHRRSTKVAAGTSKRAVFNAVKRHANSGDSGPRVHLLQRMLARMGYAVKKTGSYGVSTTHAVLAYRKVNGMRRITSANKKVFKRVWAGRGAFRLKHPGAGKHVEADLSRQVVVLAQDGKPFRVYNTSSGKPSTPTIKGSFRFYSQTPGYNNVEMYYSSYFIRGYAIHGYHSVPTYAASHGCLRVFESEAVAIYNWIDIGDRIFVYGRGKQPGRTSRPGP
jgi:lipoprotein-anchoring transpeptidase ErfK/SrfK